MKKIILYIHILLSTFGFSQDALSDLLNEYNSESVPYFTVEDLSKQENVIVLDAREFSEYKISHLKYAIHVGYDNFNIKKTTRQLKSKEQQFEETKKLFDKLRISITPRDEFYQKIKEFRN